MLNYKRFLTRIVQYSQPSQVERWLKKQQDNSSHLVAIVTDNDKVIIHDAFTGEWLARLDWSGEMIVVITPENVMSPYEFMTFNSALCFLDALLLHYFIRTAKGCARNIALASLAA